MNATTSAEVLMALDAAPAAPARGIIPALHEWIATWWLDPRERYLSAAHDHADLEFRLRAWDEREQRRITVPYLY